MNIERSYFVQPWHPALQAGLQPLFGRVFSVRDEVEQSEAVPRQWAPQVDIKEEDKRFVIYADVPGVDPQMIEISMEKGLLTLKGERKSERQVEGSKLTREERTHGVFYRRFALPGSVDAEGITASGKHGVLMVIIPKKAATTPRRIVIQSAV